MKFLTVTLFGLSAFAWAQNNDRDVQTGNAAEPPAIVHWARGAHSGGGGAKSPNMTNHGGPILPSSAVQAIFWGSSWSNSSFVADKISGLDSFYVGESGSNYAATCNEYSGSNGQVGSSLSYLGHTVDTSAAPSGAPQTSAILGEVCKVVSSPVTNGYYPVYVDTKRGNAGYCAWHSWGSCGGVNIQFAFFFNLDGDPGCDPQDTSGLHSQGLSALANVSGHELSEARTDPRGSGWYDSKGAENADKCAWTFPHSLLTFKNGSQWKIQPNWSNSAYTGGTGFPNSSGQKGCIDGN